MSSFRAALRRSYVGPIVIALVLLNGIGAALTGLRRPLATIVKQVIEALVRRAFGDVVLFPARSGMDWSGSWMFALLTIAAGALVFGIGWLLSVWLYVWGTRPSSTADHSA